MKNTAMVGIDITAKRGSILNTLVRPLLACGDCRCALREPRLTESAVWVIYSKSSGDSNIPKVIAIKINVPIVRFSPITRVNIAVSYIIYYNKEKEALKVWENIW